MKYYTAIIQIKLSDDNLGSSEELDLRFKVEESLDSIFTSIDNGYCDGGQIGCGTMEIFIEEITDIDFALDVILSHLKSLELKKEYKLAWRLNTPANDEKFKVAFATNKKDLFNFNCFDFFS